MTTPETEDPDRQSPDVNKNRSDGNGTPKPGLVIEVVLPDKKPEVERDPDKQS
jgi:hypothetical protein